MEKRITIRHEHSHEMEQYINNNLEKIEKFLSNERSPIYIAVVVTPGKIHAHNRVEVLVKTPHYEAFTEEEGPKPYEVIDIVLDRMFEKLTEEKRKFVERSRTVDKY